MNSAGVLWLVLAVSKMAYAAPDVQLDAPLSAPPLPDSSPLLPEATQGREVGAQVDLEEERSTGRPALITGTLLSAGGLLHLAVGVPLAMTKPRGGYLDLSGIDRTVGNVLVALGTGLVVTGAVLCIIGFGRHAEAEEAAASRTRVALTGGFDPGRRAGFAGLNVSF